MNLWIRSLLAGVVLPAALIILTGCGGATAEPSGGSAPRVDVIDVGVEKITTERGWAGILRPLRSVGVSAPEAGTIAELFVAEGDLVERGDRLVRMDGPELGARREVLAQRRGSLADELARWERLAAAEAAGPGEVEAARLRLLEVEEALAELEARMRAADLRAPVSGRVIALMVPADATVGAGEPLMRIEDANTSGLQLRVPAAEARYFASADHLQLAMDDGEIIAIERLIVTEDTLAPGFVAVEVRVASPGPVAPVKARLRHIVERNALLVPWTAVAREDDHHWVAVVRGDPPVIERRRVEIGAGRANGVEVRAGLEAGERVLRFEPRSQPEGREVAVHQSR
ncbi:MAG: efflux RND transporter periplasmic adaptor subunit [Opitutales bacterium]|nr:efflux RND transporter periplasmic adaptor subunit [Opitutales bacterium]